MANDKKIKDKVRLDDDFDWDDSSFDFGDDLDFDGPDVDSKSRNPIVNLGKNVFDGAMGSIKEGTAVKTFLKSALPEEYTTTVNQLESYRDLGKSLYDDLQKDIEPVLRESKQFGRRLMPTAKKYLPKGISDRLESLLGEDEAKYKAPSKEQMAETAIQSQLGEIFKIQAEQQDADRKNQEIKDQMQSALDEKRHREMFKISNSSTTYLAKLVNYQEKVTINWQRKTLELQFRQYFIQKEQLEEQKKLAASLDSSLKALIKNTALPDFAKIKYTESAKENLRNRFINSALDSNFARNFTSNLRKNIGEKVTNVKNALLEGFEQGGDMLDQLEMADGNMSMKDLAAFTAGGLGIEFFAKKLGGKSRSLLDKHAPGVRKGIVRFNNKLKNQERLLRDFAKKGFGENIALLGPIFQALNDTILQTRNVTRVDANLRNVKNLSEASFFDNRTRITINDIIPSYLGNIHRSIESIRTGMNFELSAPLMKWDYNGQKLITDKKNRENIYNSIFGKDRKARVTSGMNDVVDQLIGDNEELKSSITDGEKAVIARYLYSKRKEGIDIHELQNPEAYKGDFAQNKEFLSNFFINTLGKAKTKQELDKELKERKEAAKGIKGKADFATWYATRDLGYDEDKYGKLIDDLQREVRSNGFTLESVADAIESGNVDYLNELGILQNGIIDGDLIADKMYDPSSIRKTGYASGGIVGNWKDRLLNRFRRRRGGYTGDGSKWQEAGKVHAGEVVFSQDDVERSGGIGVVEKIRKGGLDYLTKLSQKLKSHSKKNVENEINPDKGPVEQLKRDSTIKDILLHIADNTDLILEKIKMGIHIGGVSLEGLDGLADGAIEFGGKAVNSAKKKAAWYKRSVASLLGDLGGLGIRTGKWAFNTGWDMTKRTGGLAFKIPGMVFKGLKSTADYYKEKRKRYLKLDHKNADEFDLFVGQEKAPRMLSVRLKQGMYFNRKDGKVLTSYSQIIGDVVDSEGNVVLYANEIPDARCINPAVDKTIALKTISKIKDIGKGLYNFTKGNVDMVTGLAMDVGKFALDKTIGLLYKAEDVYVKGEEEPALLAIIMKNGGYVSKRNPKKVIKHPGDIDGPVLFADTGDVALSTEQLKKGLVNKHGKPLRTGLGKIFGAVGDIAKFGFDTMLSVGRGIKGIGKSLFGGIKNFFAYFFGDGGIIFANSNKIIDKMDLIYKLLDARLPNRGNKIQGDTDGDGDRDGSIKDQREKRKDELARKKEELLRKKEAATQAMKEKAAKMKESMLNAPKTLKELFFGKDEEEEQGNNDNGDVYIDSNGNDRDGRRRKKSRWDRMKQKGRIARKKAMRKLGRPFRKVPGKGGRLMSMGKNAFGGITRAGGGLIRGAANVGGGLLTRGMGALGTGAKGIGLGLGLGALSYGARAAGMDGVAGALDTAGNIASYWTMGSMATQMLGMGSLGSIVSGAVPALGTAASALGGGLAAAGSAAMTGLSTAAAFLATNPVGWAILAGAAVAGLGYMAYKFFSKWKPGPLGWLRYVQYGFPDGNKDWLELVGDLEHFFEDGNTEKVGNQTKLKDDVDIVKFFKIFDADLEDREHCMKILEWYNSRFKPVFETWLNAANQIKGGIESKDWDDKLSATEKSSLLVKVQLPGFQGFNYLNSPFKDLSSLSDGNAVSACYNKSKEEIDKEVSKEGGGKSAGTAAALAATTITGKQLQAEGKEAPTTEGAKPQTEEKSFLRKAFDYTAPGLALMGGRKLLNLFSKDNEGNSGVTDAAKNALTNTVKYGILGGSIMTAINLFKGDGESGGTKITSNTSPVAKSERGKIPALSAVKWKAYGLVDFDEAKIKALKSLESLVLPYVEMSPDYQAVFTGDELPIAQEAAKYFGINNDDTKGISNLSRYLVERFIPVLVSWVSMAGKLSNQTDPMKMDIEKISDKKKINIATEMIRADNIWAVTRGPWPGYDLNSDISSTEIHLNILRALEKSTFRTAEGKETSADEQNKKDEQTAGTDYNNQKQLQKENEKRANEMDKNAGGGLWDKFKDFGKNALDKVKEFGQNALDKTREVAQTVTDTAGDAWYNVKEGFKDLIGVGANGSVKDVPQSKGVGWLNNKDTILAAARIVGVDPGLMAAMSAQESGFNPGVKAGTSSATGLFQFIKSTWDTMVKSHGARYGIAPGTPATNAAANALLGAQFIKDNYEGLKRTGIEPTPGDLYLAHFAGLGGARKLMRADQGSIAANVLPSAAKANKSIFYENGRPLSVAEVRNKLTGYLYKKHKSFNIDVPIAGGLVKGGGEQPVVNTAPPLKMTSQESQTRANMAAVNQMSKGGSGGQSSTPAGGGRAARMARAAAAGGGLNMSVPGYYKDVDTQPDTPPSGGSGGAGGNFVSGVSKTGIAKNSLNAAANITKRVTTPKSSGSCAKSVRLSLMAGGYADKFKKYGWPVPAADYGPYLEKYGFTKVGTVRDRSRSPSWAQPGDVAVWPRLGSGEGTASSRKYGHIQLLGTDGVWRSDFKQAQFGPGSSYRRSAVSFPTIYRDTNGAKVSTTADNSSADTGNRPSYLGGAEKQSGVNFNSNVPSVSTSAQSSSLTPGADARNQAWKSGLPSYTTPGFGDNIESRPDTSSAELGKGTLADNVKILTGNVDGANKAAQVNYQQQIEDSKAKGQLSIMAEQLKVQKSSNELLKDIKTILGDIKSIGTMVPNSRMESSTDSIRLKGNNSKVNDKPMNDIEAQKAVNKLNSQKSGPMSKGSLNVSKTVYAS